MAAHLQCSSCSAFFLEGSKGCASCGGSVGAGEHLVGTGDALVGRQVAGKFTLRRLIGAGAMGHVYAADQVALGRTVAVKVLRPQLAGDPELVSRFHDEALAASRLNHPNTVSIIDYGQTDDRLLYIVMEYLRGRTLTQVITREGPLPLPRVVGLLDQVLTALEEAHAAGVIHADLKSDNVVVETLRGGGDLVKVVDFGIARLIDPAPVTELGAESGPTRTGTRDRSICGTPDYMAPEVIHGGVPTVASDVYAVGVMLYELLCGATPFGGGAALDVLLRHLHDAPVAPRVRCPGLGIPEALEAVVLRALEKQPDARFPDAGAFRAALARALPAEEGAAALAQPERLCAACGALGPERFRFCPQCGAPMEDVHEDAAAGESTGESRATGRFAAPSGEPDPLLPLPFVGRAEELERAAAHLTGEGVSPAILVVAPSGGGRSRLLRAACERAAGWSITTYLAGADPSGLATPWYPVRAIVAAILELPDLCPLELVATRLMAVGLTRRDLPGMAELFGLDAEIGELEPAARRRECVAATLRVLRAAASPPARAALVFDDADRYDSLTLDLIRKLTERPVDGGIRIVLAVQPGVAAHWPEGVPRLELPPLGREDVAAVAAHLQRLHPGAPDAAALARASGGLPLHLEHVIRDFVEGGDPESAPGGLPDLIARRIERLPVDARVVLQAVAVAGFEADRATTARVLASDEHAEAALDHAVPLLEARGLIAAEGERLILEHPLVRDVAYHATPVDARRGLHRAWLEAVLLQGAGPAVVGHHADLAELPELAAGNLADAGEAAARRFDDTGAAALFRRAAGAARRELAGGADAARERFLSVAVRLAESLRITGALAEARAVLDEALRICGRRFRGLEARLRRVLGHVAFSMGDPEAAAAPFREAVGLAILAGDPDLVADLYLDLASAHLRAGDGPRAILEVREGIDFVTLGEGLAASAGPTALWRLVARLADLHRAAGERRLALVAATHALRHAERAGSVAGRARVHALLARLYEQERDHAAASRHRDAAIAETRRLGDRRATAELLLSGSPARASVSSRDDAGEAALLAEEIGWEPALPPAVGGGGASPTTAVRYGNAARTTVGRSAT